METYRQDPREIDMFLTPYHDTAIPIAKEKLNLELQRLYFTRN